MIPLRENSAVAIFHPDSLHIPPTKNVDDWGRVYGSVFLTHMSSMIGKIWGWFFMFYQYSSGWWYTYPSEKYESHLG